MATLSSATAAQGRLFEVTTEGDIVWEYMNPETSQWRGEKNNRAVFRAIRYAVDGPEVRGQSVVPRQTVGTAPSMYCAGV